MMKILIVSDAWYPQINGVVRTLDMLRRELDKMGHEVLMVTPDRFQTMACPTYPEIRLAIGVSHCVGKQIESFSPDAIHIATEGPLGWAARRWCLRRNAPFTTAYHTRFPEYVKARLGIPTALTSRFLRSFHAPSSGVMVATGSVRRELTALGYKNLRHWTRGVDTDTFRPRAKGFLDLPRPIYLYVGRISVEKNIDDFLKADLDGSKVLIGDGPRRETLMRRYPQAHFLGAKTGIELAHCYADADVFVFPSRTDTFGLVILEALASGIPVAAYPVPGPLDIIGNSGTGCLSKDLALAARSALTIPASYCRQYAMHFSWRVCAKMFVYNLVNINAGVRVRAAGDYALCSGLHASDLT